MRAVRKAKNDPQRTTGASFTRNYILYIVVTFSVFH
jgi:hypothetical protein